MGQISAKLRSGKNNLLMFWCPGCERVHAINYGLGRWTWNGNADRPTFSPSILVRSGHYAPGHEGNQCWCTYNVKNPENPSGFKCQQCHTFVTDGQIQFLSDCTHALAGQTLPIPDLPAGYRDDEVAP